MAEKASGKSGRWSFSNIAFWFVIAFILMNILLSLFRDSAKEPATPEASRLESASAQIAAIAVNPDFMTRRDATGACMTFIKKILHDPDSAQFGHSDEAEVFLSEKRAFVIRSVRAKNAFGALRLQDFACFMEKEKGAINPVLITEKGTNKKATQELIKSWGITVS